ncbi:uncharacterized protein LOC126549698 [Aphis gossypii]|uniref:uncharacterized protein LOC126549698 n=1 Tax=Aphis gossypii TaxID=80765 RepID=UPI0021598516|nr:uncharacterized protein LOC126549698 [Aphis gossypii]
MIKSSRTKRRRLQEEIASNDLFNKDHYYIENAISLPSTSTNFKLTENSKTEINSNLYIIQSPHVLETNVDNNHFEPIENNTPIIAHNNNSNNNNESMEILLAKWALTFNICQNSLNGLLKILRACPFNLSTLPKDARTIMRTKNVNNLLEVVPINPGEYYHFGLAVGLQTVLKNVCLKEINIVEIVIGIDGLPLSKSSKSQFWPILGYARPYSNAIFLIGLYWRNAKPKDSNQYLQQFVDETKILLENAKSFILQIKGHSGFSSCTRCTKEGEYIENRMCFPYVTGESLPARTHNDYITKKDHDHHIGTSISILKNLPNFDIVKSFSLDYMHLICLGVVRKLIHLWIGKGPLNVRLRSSQIKEISTILLKLRPFITNDFSRKPRGLDEIHYWKATELRQFLLYTGPLVLKNILNKNCYKHFMVLNIATTILLSPHMQKYVDFASELLKYFVETFGQIYGVHMISHNVHGLLHIVDDYNSYGPLDNISCFPFEDYMKTLKKKIRKQEKPLQQVIKRYNEEQNNFQTTIRTFNKINLTCSHSSGPLIDKNDLNGSQYQKINIGNFTINTKNVADSYILTQNNKVVQVLNIVESKKHNIIIIERYLKLMRQYLNNQLILHISICIVLKT